MSKHVYSILGHKDCEKGVDNEPSQPLLPGTEIVNPLSLLYLFNN